MSLLPEEETDVNKKSHARTSFSRKNLVQLKTKTYMVQLCN